MRTQILEAAAGKRKGKRNWAAQKENKEMGKDAEK